MNLSKEKIIESLHAVIDPEVGLSIVDMGLVYAIEFLEDGVIKIEMTLTTPGCPMESYMKEKISKVMSTFTEVKDAQTEIIWTPPWSPNLIKPGAMEALRNGTYVPGNLS